MIGIKQKLVETGQRAGLISAGSLCLLVGLGFLTGALYIWLSLEYGALTAAAIIGAGYCGLGLIFIGFGLSSKTPAPPARAADTPDQVKAGEVPPVLQAFLHGMQAGADVRPTRRG